MKQHLNKVIVAGVLLTGFSSCTTPPEPAPTDWAQEASKQYELGSFSEAVRLYEKSIAVDGASFEAYYALGRCQAQLKQYGKSVKAFEQAIALGKNSGSTDLKEAEVRLMIAYYDAGLYDASIAAAEVVLGTDSTHLQAYACLAKSHYALKDFDAALKTYKNYLPKMNPSAPERVGALKQAAFSAYGLKKGAEARKYYEEYFKLKQAKAQYITNDDWYWRGQIANVNLETELKNLYWSKLPKNFLKSKGVK